MDNGTKELLRTLDQQKMVEELHQFCAINSGTDNLPGLKTMADTLKQAFSPLADAIEIHSLPEISSVNLDGEMSKTQYADSLFIRKRLNVKRRILLCGHMDTVYSANHPFQTLKYLSENTINGPGVADMKGGLIVILNALTAFEQSSIAADLGWDVFINTDEEIGSLASSSIYEQIARNYQAALVYEPAMNIQGTLAKNRRGSGKITIVATGKSAHVGRAFFDGRNAICYLAEIITQVNALNSLDNGITINVGKIAGGDALNMVPDKAVIQLDIRISKPEDAEWVHKKLHEIQMNNQREGYSLSIHGDFTRPVKRIQEGTERLFQRIQKVGQALGQKIDWQDSGGCCDGNNLAHYGLPVIDTLGVCGGNIHSKDEFIVLDSLVNRAALSTLLLLDLAEDGLLELHR